MKKCRYRKYERHGRAEQSVTEGSWRTSWSKVLKCCLGKDENVLEYPVNEFRVFPVFYRIVQSYFERKITW